MTPELPSAVRRKLLEAQLGARLELERRQRQRSYRNGAAGAWAWLGECVWTEDPLDRCFKAFPAHEPWAQYLRWPVDLYCDADSHLDLLPKSRRMIISWLQIALRVWKAGHFPHENIYLAARKLGLNENEGSLEMLKRARQILEHLRGDPIRCEIFRDHIDFPDTQSRIVAVAQGADQLRGIAATDILMDECAFWEETEATFIAARPTIEQRGKITMVSSAALGFFWDMVNDRTGGVRRTDLLVPTRQTAAEGVTCWKNPGNGAHVLQIHYRADLRKRAPEWKEKEAAGMSLSGWRREYEIEGDSFAGTPVFEGEYDDAYMVKPHLRVDPHRPLLRSWDWGYRHPVCVVGQLYDSRQLRIFAAWMGTNVDLQVFAEQCLRKCRERWMGKAFLDAGDFAGNQHKGVGVPEVDLLRMKFGITVATRYMLETEPLAWLRKLMRETYRIDPREPCFLIEQNPDTEELRRALRGGYVLDKFGKPANDGTFEHLGDALKYLNNFEHEGSKYQEEMDRAANEDIIDEKHYDFDDYTP